MGMEKYLHKSAADSFFRIALIVAALTLVGAVLILSLPAPHPKAVNYVDAVREHPRLIRWLIPIILFTAPSGIIFFNLDSFIWCIGPTERRLRPRLLLFRPDRIFPI